MPKPTVLIWDDDDYAAGLYARKFEEEKWRVKIAASYEQLLAELRRRPQACLVDYQTLKKQKIDPKDWRSKTKEAASLLALLIDIKKVTYPDKIVEEYDADTYLIKGHFVPSEAVAKVTRLVAEDSEQ